MATINAGSMSDFSSWTDADLVRAVELDPDHRQTYIDQLAVRAIARTQLQAATDAVQAGVSAKIKELLDG